MGTEAKPTLISAVLIYDIDLPEGLSETQASFTREKHPLKLLYSNPSSLPFPSDFPVKYCLPRGLGIASLRIPVQSFSFVIPRFANVTEPLNAACVIIHQRKKLTEKVIYVPLVFVVTSRLPLKSSLEDMILGLIISSKGKDANQIDKLASKLMQTASAGDVTNVMFDEDKGHITRIPTSGSPYHLDCPPYIIGQVLDANNLLSIIHHLLLERPVVLISSQRSLLNIVGSALITFLLPFKWNFPYIPICCSADLDALMRDPKGQPFLVGFCSNDETPRINRAEKSTIAEVHIDENRVILPHPQPRPLPLFLKKPLYEAIRRSFQPDLAFFDTILFPQDEPRFSLNYFLEALASFYSVLLNGFDKYTLRISFDSLEADLKTIRFNAPEIKDLKEKCNGIIFQKTKFCQDRPDLEAILPSLVDTKMFRSYIIDKVVRSNSGDELIDSVIFPGNSVTYQVDHNGMFGLSWLTLGNTDEFADFTSLQNLSKNETPGADDLTETESDRDVTQTSVSGYEPDDAFHSVVQHTFTILGGNDITEDEFVRLCRLLLHRHLRSVCLLVIKAASAHESFAVISDGIANALVEIIGFLLDVCQREREYTNPRLIYDICSTMKREYAHGPEPLLNTIRTHPFWQDYKYWEESFSTVLKAVEKNTSQIFGEFNFMVGQMMACNIPAKKSLDFSMQMLSGITLDEETQLQLQQMRIIMEMSQPALESNSQEFKNQASKFKTLRENLWKGWDSKIQVDYAGDVLAAVRSADGLDDDLSSQSSKKHSKNRRGSTNSNASGADDASMTSESTRSTDSRFRTMFSSASSDDGSSRASEKAGSRKSGLFAKFLARSKKD